MYATRLEQIINWLESFVFFKNSLVMESICNKPKIFTLITFFDKKGNHNIDEWLPKLKNIAKESDPVIIICRSGKRSGIVSKFLDEQADFTNVYNASGGMLSWVNSNNKTIKPN